jgi:uncharacterized YigZ family protein
MKDTYRTIASDSEGIYRSKGSKFIALAQPVESEENIKSRLKELRKSYHDARHHCYAWRLGSDYSRYRVNDDGEPSGTAGKPIMGQIETYDLTNVLIVVVRYFGGTLLGVGGLIKAYREAAADALNKASIAERKVTARFKLEFGYLQLNAVMKIVKDYNLDFEEQRFDMDCSMVVRIWLRREKEVIAKLSLIDNCKLTPGNGK